MQVLVSGTPEWLWHRTPEVSDAARWTLEAEVKEPDAPCRRVNSIYTMHAVMVEVQFKHDGYDILSELGMPKVRVHPVLILTLSSSPKESVKQVHGELRFRRSGNTSQESRMRWTWPLRSWSLCTSPPLASTFVAETS